MRHIDYMDVESRLEKFATGNQENLRKFKSLSGPTFMLQQQNQAKRLNFQSSEPGSSCQISNRYVAQ